MSDPLPEVQELFQASAGSVDAPDGGGDFGLTNKLVAALGEPGVMSQVRIPLALLQKTS